MAKTAKRALGALLAALMLLTMFGAAAAADLEDELIVIAAAEEIVPVEAEALAIDIDGQELAEQADILPQFDVDPANFGTAVELNAFLPQIVSPSGYDGLLISGSNVYCFTANRTTRYRIRTTSIGIYPRGAKLADLFGNFPGSNILFFMLSPILSVLDFIFPYTKPSVQVYIKAEPDEELELLPGETPEDKYELLCEAGKSGFPWYKNNRYDVRLTFECEEGQTYYVVVGAEETTFNLPFLLYVWPWI